MYSIRIRDHILIAHSLPGKAFGPAQKLHGATFVVDVIFRSPRLDENNTVIDIGRAREVVREVLADLDYKNLDEHPATQDALTTAEYMARFVHDRVKTKLDGAFTGTIEVILGESHIAWAGYTGTHNGEDL